MFLCRYYTWVEHGPRGVKCTRVLGWKASISAIEVKIYGQRQFNTVPYQGRITSLCEVGSVGMYCTENPEYRTTPNLTDFSNYSDSFANYFLTSNRTVHLKFLEWVTL